MGNNIFANDLFESVEWKDLIDGAVALDTDAMAENMRSKGYRKESEVIDEIIELIKEQSQEPKHHGYKDVRNDELAQLTIKILKKYKGE